MIIASQVAGGEEPALPTEEMLARPKPQPKEPPAWSAKEAFCTRLRELRLKYRHAPAKYKGYEALLEGADASGDSIPRGKVYLTTTHVHVHVCTCNVLD